MTSKSENQLLPEFDRVKDSDEDILWTGKPKFIPYAITGLGLGIGAFIFAGVYYFMTKNIKKIDGISNFFYCGAQRYRLYFF